MRTTISRLVVAALTAAAIAVPAAAQDDNTAIPAATAAPTPTYWQARGCTHGHPSRVAYRATSSILKSPAVLTRKRWQRAHHYAVCLETKAKSAAVKRHVRSLMAWRASQFWRFTFLRLPGDWQRWAYRTAECESHNGRDPNTNSHGFRGRFQWVMGTWYAAGGSGDPWFAGFFHEAVIAVGLARREGTHHWPRCG